MSIEVLRQMCVEMKEYLEGCLNVLNSSTPSDRYLASEDKKKIPEAYSILCNERGD